MTNPNDPTSAASNAETSAAGAAGLDRAARAAAGFTNDDQIYVPEPGERQLTLRAVLTGCLIGGVVGSMNVSLGLKIGWSFGGSIIAAILGFSLWAFLHQMFQVRRFGVLETNIAQTTGSAAGAMASAAGLLAPIPALAMLDGDNAMRLSYVQLTLWSLAVGYLGVFFAVPLRNQMVVVEKLRFPTGTATAQTIVSIFAEGAEAIRKAKVLLIFALVGLFVIALKTAWFDGYAQIAGYVNNPLSVLLGGQSAQSLIDDPSTPLIIGMAAIMIKWGFFPIATPAMTGAGLIVGPRIGLSILAGALIGWGLLGPYVMSGGGLLGALFGGHDGWTERQVIMDSRFGVQGWILWPGVAIMVGDALMSLALSWRTILNTFRRTTTADPSTQFETPEQRVPNSWWIGGLALGTIAAVVVMELVFGIPFWMTLIAVALSAVLAAIAVRSTGETDINPVGGMGKVTQLAFAGVAPGQIPTNLMAAAVTGSGASQAGDMMHDLKTGRMLGASPRKQIIAQCIGITAGILIVVPVYWVFSKVYTIGEAGGEYPAPAAHAWRGVAEVLATGFGSLPPYAPTAIVIGLIFGALVPIVRKIFPKAAPYTPSALAMGIAFIVPPAYPVMMFLGSMVLVVWRKLRPVQCKALVFAVASGLIAGEGVMNVIVAVWSLAKEWLSG
ncbi:MAG: OPT/YSL family transporter [Phycisphaeraceae bacterium]|nr:OPT/YSL family transporter [Phycisphaeraceae bacterium]MCW5763486.1 OPT/YSL family transporter [Phycisphaeraceae bacterium]